MGRVVHPIWGCAAGVTPALLLPPLITQSVSPKPHPGQGEPQHSLPPGLSFASLCGQFIMAGTSNVLLMEVYYRALSAGSTVCRDAAPTRIRPSPSGPIAEAAGGCWGGRAARMRLCSFGGDCFQQPGLFLSTITINKASERVFIFPLQIFSSSCFLPVHTADWGALQQGGPRSRLLLPPHHRSCPCSHSCSCSCS